MPFGSSQWMYASGFYNNVATQSLRFDDGSSAYLTRTPSSAGNRKTWTWSSWIKRSNLGANSIFEGGTASNNSLGLQFDSASQSLQFFVYNGSSVTVDVKTTQVFRDVSAWYHIVMGFDTTQATASNRVKLYVNGSQITDLATSTYPSQNTDFNINNTNTHQIGRSVFGSSNYFDGYMADVNFVDGQALTPTSFGEFKNGVWIPIEYTGSYGTNGFRLQFNQTGTGTASSSTIGADTSGNANHFTSSGIVASDCYMPDSPENNFCTLNPLDDDGHTNAEGNLKVSGNVIYGHEKSTFAVTSGKWYFEGKLAVQQNDTGIGLANQNASTLNHYLGQTSDSLEYASDGRFFYNGGTYATYTSYTTTDIVQIAFDADTGEIWIGKNNTWQNSGNPANGTGEVVTVSWSEFIASARTVGSGEMVFNFGQDDTFAGAISATGNTDGNGVGVFKYAPPSGFLALCTANLPEPTISPNQTTQADDYFNTVLYTGNGSSGHAITGVGFQPDWVWIKSRSGAANHGLHDSSRVISGNEAILNSNTTSAESTGSAYLSSFDSDGFTVNNNSSGNNSSDTYVSWNWKANGGTTASNTDGSITSTVQANTTAGFSIITYNGNATASTIGHGLNKIPQMVIVKERGGARPWVIYHANNTSAPETDYLRLNETNATADFDMWNDTAPTSSVFSVSSYDWVNNNASPFVAYCFAEIEGYSKFGSYTGNGSTDGTFVYTGFRPAWVMFKRTDSADNWVIFDIERDTHNVVQNMLKPNLSNAESTEGGAILDFVSNGFKLKGDNAVSGVGQTNKNTGTYIYMAFAEAPFKYANAR